MMSFDHIINDMLNFIVKGLPDIVFVHSTSSFLTCKEETANRKTACSFTFLHYNVSNS